MAEKPGEPAATNLDMQDRDCSWGANAHSNHSNYEARCTRASIDSLEGIILGDVTPTLFLKAAFAPDLHCWRVQHVNCAYLVCYVALAHSLPTNILSTGEDADLW